jgi:hypothetical protein
MERDSAKEYNPEEYGASDLPSDFRGAAGKSILALSVFLVNRFV